MKLRYVLGSTNNNPEYYKFIPSQIQFWGYFGIRFIAVFIGDSIPNELLPFKQYILHWPHTPQLNSIYVSQTIRLLIPSLIKMLDDECIMITDMDMLPASPHYYINDIEKYSKDSFIYYRHQDLDEFYMCYNAAHSKTWAKLFDISSTNDIIKILIDNFPENYTGQKDVAHSWFNDQKLLCKKVHNYEHLVILNRPIKRLEVSVYLHHLNNNHVNFIKNYDDIHFHQSYNRNEVLIKHALTEIILFQDKILS